MRCIIFKIKEQMSELEKNNDISYILNELGEDRDLYFNAIAPPIIQTSNFVFNKVDDLRKAFEEEFYA